ncbi:MAG TPA: GNAT family acetyltransferase [Leptospiraceae bacterium]|nr:GNAT family acetyltransferase [Spirochaetaceae bacterium]HBS05804.1 GNAT family acetyltransferase [Leptospiraceae bacterium]|tara:strand:+ start:75323 stop:75793 length:471 start_codon:yes stop_codon:yes gene_type:complete
MDNFNPEPLSIRPFRPEDRNDVRALWKSAGLVRPWNNPDADINRKLRVDPELFLVAVWKEDLVGTVMGGYDGHRGWVNYLATDPEYRNRGIARKLVQHLETELLKRGCPKINLQIREENQEVRAFYEKLGYSVDAAISMGKRMIEDSLSQDIEPKS